MKKCQIMQIRVKKMSKDLTVAPPRLSGLRKFAETAKIK